MTSRLILVLAIAVVAGGCEKKPEVSPASNPTGVAEVSSNAPASTGDAQIDLAQMSRDLRRWILKNQRPPKDFEDYAATAQVTLPQPPPGKKFAITKQMNVILVER